MRRIIDFVEVPDPTVSFQKFLAYVVPVDGGGAFMPGDVAARKDGRGEYTVASVDQDRIFLEHAATSLEARHVMQFSLNPPQLA